MLNIALDGHAGSGKGTLAKLLAEKLGLKTLDTGAMYRAIALKCKNMGISVSDEKNVNSILESLDLKVKYDQNTQLTILDGKVLSAEIRTEEIGMLASTVSKLRAVREKMVYLQRKIAEGEDIVIEGRDAGTAILPDAPVKIFLTATPEERAKRRIKQLNIDPNEYEETLKSIICRDNQDESRELSPLVKADDALYLDNSNLSLEQELDICLDFIKAKTGYSSKN